MSVNKITTVEANTVKRSLKNRKIVYVVNPISGGRNKNKLVALIEKYSKTIGLYCYIHEASSTGNYELLKEKIREENITDVVIVGGDGTVSAAISALRGVSVVFGIIPYGSGNGLARAAGIPLHPKRAFDKIIEGSYAAVDAFTVNEKYCCMLTGLGFDAAVAHRFAQSKKRGLISYTQQSILQYFKAQPYAFEIEVDGISFFTDAFFISVANGNQFGNNFTIAPKASLDDGMLDIVIVQKMSKAVLPIALLQQISGNNKLQKLVKNVTNKNILYFQTPSVKIKNIKLAPLHIDGEAVEPQKVLDMRILPKDFYLIK